ncbi:MAG: glycoside hydrolase family 5 protein [Lachnospiraceae bacterium]|nr:glycoside hydrolase family 5 protein [Ruminococcus sp.]MCM1273977.1 glycoside hydrolase family 5 protein [Lachnospiraceae bacterium]
MRKNIIAAALMSLCLLFTGCNNEVNNNSPSETSTVISDSTAESDVQIEAAAGFHVDGTKLLDANGNEFIMRGINHAHVWFKDKLETALDGIAAAGANTVRIVLADGDQWEKTTAEDLENTILECNKRKMIAVVEVHDACGMDDRSYLDHAVDYWIEMKNVLAKYTDTAILNITNEWIGQWNAEAWHDGYVDAVARLRAAGIKNTIMVDAAGWGQYGESIHKYGAEVFAADPDGNTMFSIHMYGSAGKNAGTITRNLKGVTDQELCTIVGEFGFNHSDGDVDEAFIMQYCTENGLGYLGWSWKGNGGGVEYLDIAVDWGGETLSEDWGEPLINGEFGIKSTAKTCSVFE